MYCHLDQTAEPHSKINEATAVNVLATSEDEVHKELNNTFYINVIRN